MPNVSTDDIQPWCEATKLTISALDNGLETQISAEVLGKLVAAYDVSGWTDALSTPVLVRKVIAMQYASWLIQRTYSEDSGDNEYALRLLATSESVLANIIDGTTVLPDDAGENLLDSGVPLFYPNDASSALQPTADNPSDGGPAFTMGVLW